MAPPIQFCGLDVDIERVTPDVYDDLIAVADHCKRAASCGFGTDMADHHAMGRTREAAVRDKRDAVS
jgi:hypothetical protein